ncbi:FAD-dependent oxidoreductase [Streptomyces sp. NBC_01221]|uniref:flavin monoamine oxidase family protein n=1 Tax=unclassified Streptomyces TaxID=2593676 RepID=UPI00225AA05D|nr:MULTISPECIES: NAD(P)/FAD-dependent oxidoreductase [unclassified Streptomyces]MCX4788937.1 FAD-dependent oxidoreductase [Streptomyces sp. NBC_01221]WSJ36624.1 FAD-dependent oxidoreductase [Streptomyces sp. NBC_01321]WSP57132.1 FAD-dependent oxidoreductase [Streptomyces sp. NBC_01241]
MAGFQGRTRLSTQLRAMFSAHEEAARTGVPVEEIQGRRAAAAAEGASRRQFLRGAAGGLVVAAAGGLGVNSLLQAPAANAATAPRVVIVGAGLAGLRTAHDLYRRKGVAATVYEGNTRAGGRCWSLRNFFDAGQVVEHGGAFINTDHTATRNLAASLGLPLRVVGGGNQSPYGDKYWIDGALYTTKDANADWKVMQPKFAAELAAAPYPQTYGNYTARGRQLDLMTVDEWLTANVPGGLGSRFAKLMQSNVLSEYGLDPGQQPALNLIYLLGWNSPGSLAPLAGDDEKYSVIGGNDQIVTGMINQLPSGTVQYGKKLTALRSNLDGTVTCTFSDGPATTDVTADKVVLALPFTTLRDCDLTRAGFSALKTQAIQQLDLGANAKLHVQFATRPWVTQKYGGVAYTNPDTVQTVWDDTVGQALPQGVLCQFPAGSMVTGGWTGAAFDTAPAAQVSTFLSRMEPIFPGVTAAYNGKAYRDAWFLNPWSKGAYSCPRVGQHTTLWGAQPAPEGNVHFAGEHTSMENYGFLDGAIASGERVSKEIAP